ncbi:MAG: hypothetical protein GKR98_03050 [Boseongicola sp.]|nr:MAG: hypothetical protein GKR98_03050 [Boseongicola sp.]
MRTYLAVISAVAMVTATTTQAANAPAELPPAGYKSVGFVDSQGCAFAKTELNGEVVWAPRLSAARQQICDETPTFAKANERLVVSQPVPVSVAPKRSIAKAPMTSVPKSAPTGYRKVWSDDRLNKNRGPQTAAGDAAMARVWSTDAPMVWTGN